MAHDGGPAFGGTREEQRDTSTSVIGDKVWAQITYQGMSLRDWFAGQALIGMMSNLEILKLGAPMNPDQTLAQFFSVSAYEFADAMLAERQKESK